MTDRVEDIKTKWNIEPFISGSTVPWGKDDVAWLVSEVERLRMKIRTITTEYKPGWVDGLEAVARDAGFDPDKARHEGIDPPTFIQDVIDGLRAENIRLRVAQSEDIPTTCEFCDKLRCACTSHGGKP